MTGKEAKDCIQGKLDCMNKCDVFNCKDTDECESCNYCYAQGNFGEQKKAFEMGVKALEKQIAKNWIAEYIGDGEFIWTCPSCKETFALMDGTPQDNEYNYCPSCGQALAERKICCANCRELYEEYGMKLCKIYEEPQENIDTECCEHHTLDWGNEDAE